MEILVQILILFILIGTVIKLSFNTWWQTAIVSFVFSLFIVLTYPYAILQSKTQLEQYLNDTVMMQNIAVFITFDSALMIAFAFMALRELFGKKVKPWLMQILRWFPGLLAFPVLFYLLTQSVFTFTGVDFQTIAYLLAALVLVGFPLLAIAFKCLLPDDEMRYEVHFIATIFVTISGLLTTVNGNVTYAAVEQPIDIKALVIAIAIFIILFGIGLVWNTIRCKIRSPLPSTGNIIKD
ncbi:MAG: hypothetical protein BGP01_03005 [Paludibacter sp. 47-17]|nr:MAG: hypothetical protein BGP01_03005 [Paludibacter sp. 47-17]